MLAIVDYQNAAKIIPGKMHNVAVQASVPSGVSGLFWAFRLTFSSTMALGKQMP